MQKSLVRGRQHCTQLSIFEGSLAELLRFWCCHLWQMRKSRRIDLFLMLSSSKLRKFGPTQALVYNLKVRFFHNPVEVRHELARRGYTPQRISQLVKDCEQWPPRDQRQRKRQTFQDQPNMKKGNDTSDIELTSTNEWYTIDHLDSITKCWSKYTVAWSPMPRCISSKTTRIGLYEV